MRVLVTGHLGYVGAVLSRVLRNSRFDVIGLDTGWFGDCTYGRVRDDLPAFDSDVRDIDFTDLLSVDAVVHLAGLSDDPCGDLNPELTEQINLHATLRLAELCRQAQVSRFVFASTCSVYGRAGGELLNERSRTNPLTTYAETKLAAEHSLLAMSDAAFSPVILRLGTCYGVSPSLRLDLLVNQLAAAAVTSGLAELRSDGRAWRPLVHVEDVARAIAAVLVASDGTLHAGTFNVVPPDENYRVIDVADEIVDAIPGSRRSIAPETHDHRSYRVDGRQLLRALPGFAYHWRLRQGVQQMAEAFRSGGLTSGDLRSDRFRRLPRLRAAIESRRLTGDLRAPRHEPVAVAAG